MRALLVPFVFAATTLFFAGCFSQGNGPEDVEVGPQQAAIITEFGTIVIAFYCEAAPRTVENFRQYAMDDFYQGTVFHRIMRTFMIQGGGFDTDGNPKQTRDPIPLEYQRPNERGTIAMARTGDPNSATSQFFINTDDNSQDLGPGGADSYGYTVFGRVVEGMDVVDEIAAVPVGPDARGEPSKPNDPPVIEDVQVGPGCEEAEATRGVDAGLIINDKVSDAWRAIISADTDYVPFYIINQGNQDEQFAATVTSPAAWDITVNPGTINLKAQPAERGSSYPYAAAGYLTVVAKDGFANATDANVTLTFTSADDPNTKVELQILLEVDDRGYSRVTKKGDSVQVDYTGKFDDGTVFDTSRQEGRQPLAVKVAEAGTVTGFAYGLLGLHIGETVDVRFPPELAYGYDRQGYERFSGQWLNFELTLRQLG